MSSKNSTNPFADSIDLASECLGSKALVASDEFFAEKENLLKSGQAVFIADKYTDRGKWMDGWESRRKRVPGNDWCIVRLGIPGTVAGFDIDTNHFKGNHPPQASVEGINIHETPCDESDLASVQWSPILNISNLKPDSQNIFTMNNHRTWTHLRLSIFPDGGVARFRAYGKVTPNWSNHPDDQALKNLLHPHEVDLVAARNGGLAIDCSNMFFSPMNNLILPNRATNMGGGWETRRKREPGNDWIVLKLGAPGTISFAEIDTNHFKGNFPDSFSLEGSYRPEGSKPEFRDTNLQWIPLINKTKLKGHEQRWFRSEIASHPPITHVRLNIFPDGGISRIRLYGLRNLEN